YAFHELALIPTFLLIGIWGTGNRRAAAWKVTIYLALGSVILLVGLIMLYRAVPSSARSLDLRVLQAAASAGQIAPAMQSSIYLVLLIGFGTLISLAWSRSRNAGSIGCSVIPASCTWATFFSASPARISSALPARQF